VPRFAARCWSSRASDMEVSTQWETKRYLQMNPLAEIVAIA
jgi:hypothetical protein